MSSALLFEDTFEVKDIDPDGKKFDRGMVEIFIMFKLASLDTLYY